MAASEGSLGGAGSISAAPEGPDERSPDSRPTYFLHFGRVGWSRHQVGRFSTHMVRLAAQPARRLLLDRQWAGMRWLSNAHSSACHSVWHTPGSLSCAGRCLATGCDSQPARSTAARAALASEVTPVSSVHRHHQHLTTNTTTSLPAPLGAASGSITGPSHFVRAHWLVSLTNLPCRPGQTRARTLAGASSRTRQRQQLGGSP